MKTLVNNRYFRLTSLGILCALLFYAGHTVGRFNNNKYIIVSSPNREYIASVDEVHGLMSPDRNMRITIHNNENITFSYLTPDEKPLRYTETLYWSVDSRYLLLTSESVYNKLNIQAVNGHIVYIIIDVDKLIVYSNSRQVSSNFVPLTYEFAKSCFPFIVR